jgi:hypothetical protein
MNRLSRTEFTEEDDKNLIKYLGTLIPSQNGGRTSLRLFEELHDDVRRSVFHLSEFGSGWCRILWPGLNGTQLKLGRIDTRKIGKYLTETLRDG